ncbi:ATP-binding protein [Actinomadura sp. 3N508]|uniref:ATP-binding protein n=1 Tax=Actinomadura sp. 3N508 TaxID=3375153 RepID=UPI0037A64D0B
MPATALAPEPPPTLVLESNDQAPRLARRFVTEQFAEWGIADDYDARLVVCELVTNSFVHGAGPIVLRLLREHDGRPVVEVEDKGDGRPAIQPEDDATTSGRGLLLMAQLVRAWGVRPLNKGGKVTWAKLR